MSEFQELKDLGLDRLLESLNFKGDDFLDLFQVTTHAQVWVTDDENAGCSIYVFDTNGVNKDKLLAISNKQQRKLYLWQIDGKMFEKFSKCDCALLHNNELHLIEFKANAKNESDNSIRGNYNKASEQLNKTLHYISDAYFNIGLDLYDIFSNIDAKIVFDKTVPQDNAYQKNVSSRFLDDNGVILSFGNDIDIL